MVVVVFVSSQMHEKMNGLSPTEFPLSPQNSGRGRGVTVTAFDGIQTRLTEYPAPQLPIVAIDGTPKQGDSVMRDWTDDLHVRLGTTFLLGSIP